MYDNRNVITLAESLVRIPSVSGEEEGIASFLFDRLKQRFEVQLQEVAPRRTNLIATRGVPKLLFNIHLDTVPGILPVKLKDGVLYGRGAVDAKGPLAALIIAAEQAANTGFTDFGLFLDVGEETDFIGLRNFAETAPSAELIVVCEPTGMQIRRAQKGLLECTIRVSGKAAHSATPEKGACAIERLIEIMRRIRQLSMSEDTVLGRTTIAFTRIRGGSAINVIADSAAVDVCCRLVRGDDDLLTRIRGLIGPDGEIDVINTMVPVVTQTPAVVKETLIDLAMPVEEIAMPGFTGMYYWREKGPAVVLGPGDPSTAHTNDERVASSDLERGRQFYLRLIQKLCKQERKNSMR